MFDLFTSPLRTIAKTANTIVDTTQSLVAGEMPTRRQLVNLIDAGLTINDICDIIGLSEDAVRAVLDD
jgi:DNA-binding NarL/FixJ family response regulator